MNIYDGEGSVYILEILYRSKPLIFYIHMCWFPGSLEHEMDSQICFPVTAGKRQNFAGTFYPWGQIANSTHLNMDEAKVPAILLLPVLQIVGTEALQQALLGRLFLNGTAKWVSLWSIFTTQKF